MGYRVKHKASGRWALPERLLVENREKERYKHLNAEFQRIARRDKKAAFSDQCKKIEENNRMGKTQNGNNRMRMQISARKLEIPRENFMQRWAR